jgi:apolipoprotein N-acyltransferase
LLCLVAGAVLPLAFAPFYWWWVAPLSYAVLFLAWQRATPRQAFVRGLAFGSTAFLFGVYWIYISVHGYGGAPIWIAIFLMLCLVFAMALYTAIVGWIAARYFGTGGSWHWLATLPALLVVAEWFRGWVLTGFGWLTPGYSQTESWLLGFAPILGVLGVSWAVFVLSGALATFVRGGRRDRIAAGIVVVALFGFGGLAGRIAWTDQKSEQLSVALVQGAVPQDLKWLPAMLEPQLDLYRRLTVESLGSDLIVWPEAAIPEYYENFVSWLNGIERLAADADSHVMLGMLKFHPAGAQNALFTLGQPESTYIKRHLVPYGEFFPMPDFMRPWIASMNLAFPDSQPGEARPPPVELLGERLALTICYEDVFGSEQLHYFPDATLLVNISNDGWFGDSTARHQHLQIARMRSAEVRRWQLRTTNTGMTAVIDRFGEINAQLPADEPGILRSTAPGVTGSTPYILWGNYAVLLLAGAVIGAYWLRTKLTIRPGT